MDTLTYTGSLTVTVCWCGTKHAVPTELYDHQQRRHRDGLAQAGIYCPLGHTWHFSGDGEAARLQKQLAAEQARHDQTRAELRDVEKKRQAQKAATSRIKNRIGNGVCPCCKRSFGNLQRHMKTKHPEFSKGE